MVDCVRQWERRGVEWLTVRQWGRQGVEWLTVCVSVKGGVWSG